MSGEPKITLVLVATISDDGEVIVAGCVERFITEDIDPGSWDEWKRQMVADATGDRNRESREASLTISRDQLESVFRPVEIEGEVVQ